MYYISKDDSELLIVLLLVLDYRHVPPYPVYEVLEVKPRAVYMLSKKSTN